MSGKAIMPITKRRVMNLRIILTVLLFTGFIWSGCDKAKELLDVEFDADFKVNLPVKLNGTRSLDGAFIVEETVNPLADEEIEKYIDNIKSWNVTELSGTFLQVDPDFELTNGLVKISSSSKEAIWNLDDQLITEGSEIILGNENGQWNTVNQILNDKQEFTILFSGNNSQEEDFVLQLLIETRVTANPL